ncbi:cupin domain-containing protein [Planococcus lenghuensis]|uniref:Uncharacterized protein n=1 Tax=Planococcus lenghuensis TaxID=2213202 RepID=A0A1Q2KVH8_9BACL|nr:hypothetical protein [Planococcus lenghuensis]AQQ52200.1 hypothetical protein B0X71_03110 [Planococcus lenghuensis]
MPSKGTIAHTKRIADASDVIKELVTVEIERQQHKLTEHQSLMFDANKPPYWFNYTKEIVQFLVVSSRNTVN